MGESDEPVLVHAVATLHPADGRALAWAVLADRFRRRWPRTVLRPLGLAVAIGLFWYFLGGRSAVYSVIAGAIILAGSVITQVLGARRLAGMQGALLGDGHTFSYDFRASSFTMTELTGTETVSYASIERISATGSHVTVTWLNHALGTRTYPAQLFPPQAQALVADYLARRFGGTRS